ncbi:MAG: chloride channel protein [Bacteroidota bacterium]
MKNPSIYGRFLIWKVKNIKHRYFILILSIIIGIISGLAAVTLKTTVHYIEILFTKSGFFDIREENYLLLAYPLIGIFITVVYIRFFTGQQRLGHGITNILQAISRKSSIIKLHNVYSSIIACTFTGGFGGSVGMEAPIVGTGGAIGSNIGQLFRLNYKTTTLMVACGATGAMAAIFKAPIAALIFSLEVLMLDLTIASIIPLLMASVSGALMANLLLGKQILFYFSLKDNFNINHLPFYIVLGIIAGLVSVYFTRMNALIEGKFELIQNSYRRLLIGGLALGILIFIFPPLYGEGYLTLKAILSGNSGDLLNNSLFYSFKDNIWFFLIFLFFIFAFKVLATSITLCSGGIGGYFAPIFFMGGIMGYVYAKIFNLLNLTQLSESNFALVGMAGLIAGVIHAPLTAIFLIAELTDGYELFIPLMVTSAISYFTIMYYEPHSIYTKSLAKRGELITHHKDKAVLSLMKLEDLIEKDIQKVQPDATLGELVKIISRSQRNIFPVVDENNMLLGIVPMDSIRDIMFNREMYDNTLVSSLMILPTTYVSSTDPMDEVMKKFEEANAWSLPVIDEGEYIGFILKTRLFSVYRQMLIEFSED